MCAVKIAALEAENVKRIRAVALEPSPSGLTVIGGNNNQGKTSILDTIAWALGGDRYRPSNPTRDGSTIPPRIKITLSNGLIVERAGKNSALKVTDPNGQKRGQQLLNSFVEELALNLPKFMEQSSRDKAETLLKVIGVGDQLHALELQETELYNRRHAIGQIADQKKIEENDRLLITTTDKDAPHLTILFGKQEPEDWNKQGIDWDALDNKIVSKDIVITRPGLNGKKLGSLRLRNTYAINISRVTRSGIRLLATPGLILQLGDRLTIVGEAKALEEVEKVLGNATNTLRDPNLAAIFIGIVLGLVVGSIPIAIPGISTPVKLGLAGGPIIIGILIGSFGPRFRLVTYTTRSANLMLRGIGLSLYLAGLGLDAGAHFFETVMRPEGAAWIGIGFAITFIPVVLMALFALRISRLDFGSTCGMLCGSMANPMALNYANETLPGDNPAVSYATVYPLSMFCRVIIAQIILMFFI